MNPSPLKTILIFEPLAGGHRANFIGWLKRTAPEYSGCRFVFFTAAEAGDSPLGGLGWWARQRRLYELFRSACEQVSPDHVLILELTHLELPLALFGAPVPLSAILFVQYPELAPGLKRVFKHWKTRLLLARAPVQNIFLLNGENSAAYLSDRFGSRARFIPVADPVPDALAERGFSFDVETGRRICLFFGAISPRKGADLLLRVLRDISPRAAGQNAFVLCGEPEAGYREAFLRAVTELREARPDLCLVVEDQFVSDERMMAMFEQANLILMPYARPEYSSGILSLAAHVQTPVLGPSGGLLGRLIRENGLGLAEDLTQKALENPVMLDAERCRAFNARNSGNNFAKPILEAICGEG